MTSPAPVATALRVLGHHRRLLDRLSTDPNARFRHGVRRGLDALALVDDALTTPAELEALSRVVQLQQLRLAEQADAERECAWFTAGVAWGLYSLERIARALRDVTDPVALGLAPAAPPTATATPLRPPEGRTA